MINKAKMFSFLKRNYWEFTNVSCPKVLCFALVRSILEYDSVLWSLYQYRLINKVENLKTLFLRTITYKMNKADDDLNIIGEKFDIEKLVDRR